MYRSRSPGPSRDSRRISSREDGKERRSEEGNKRGDSKKEGNLKKELEELVRARGQRWGPDRLIKKEQLGIKEEVKGRSRKKSGKSSDRSSKKDKSPPKSKAQSFKLIDRGVTKIEDIEPPIASSSRRKSPLDKKSSLAARIYKVRPKNEPVRPRREKSPSPIVLTSRARTKSR